MEYSNPRMTAVVENWPSGGLRTTAHFAIEQVRGRGERATRYTIHPKTGKPSSVKKLTYARKQRLVDGDDGRIYIIEWSPMYGHISIMRGTMDHQAEPTVFPDNPRYADLLKLLGE